MIGRAAYHTPYMLADIEKEIFGTEECSKQTRCN